MLRAVERIAQEQDLGLVALSGLACFLFANVCSRLRDGSGGLPLARSAAACAVLACGLWAATWSGAVPAGLLAGGAIGLAAAGAASALRRHRAASGDRTAPRQYDLADATFEGLVLERGGWILDANRAMSALTGQERPELIGRPVAAAIREATRLSAPGQATECDLLRADGTARAIEVLWKNGPEPGTRIVAVRDAGRERAAQSRRTAQTDRLTGLPNRDGFLQAVRKALEDRVASPGLGALAILHVDLDRFEAMQEAVGDRASDDVVVEAARRLAAAARPGDTVARIGRDEFAVLQPLLDRPADPAALADRIVGDLAAPYRADGSTVPLTASVGVALYPLSGATADALVRCARLAVRRAKHEGRSRWKYFEPGTDTRRQALRCLEKDLGDALAAGQFEVHYQAFFDAETQAPTGAEALLRWDHPTKGRISPADFIPLAEANGMIVPIGAWVLETACRFAAGWDRPATIAVNLSPAQFAHQGLVDTVAATLQRTGLPPDRLELEITEGILIQDTEYALRILRALKGLGVRIAMDDFGTGYSSLSYLRKFPFDKIKIDRSFLTDEDGSDDADNVVAAIIDLGHRLHRTVTAEGVETRRQLAMLRRNGCDTVQGFLLAKPCRDDQLDLSPGRPGWLQPGSAQVVNGAAPRAAAQPA